MTLFHAPADELIKQVAIRLKEQNLTPPDWAWHVKTGSHRENQPQDIDDWWFIRTAAVFRKIYIHSPQGIGVERLRSPFGGRKEHGSQPKTHAKGSGNILRTALQELEKLGYVETIPGRGRVVSPQGRSFLDKEAHTVASKHPELEKYFKKA